MKSITIHNLDTEMSIAIEKLAKSTGLSQNKMIKKLLRKSLGIGESPKPEADFSKFCGLWSEKESLEFNKAIKIFDQIDEELWQ